MNGLVRVLTATAQEGHGWEPAYEQPEVRLVRVSRPALVIGSAQSEGHLDQAAARAAGYDVVRRRSGGGVVELGPSALWVDVAIPRDEPRWCVDVGRAAGWVGRAWMEALVPHLRPGLVPGLSVHEGPPLAAEAGRSVCFAGVGSGEVLVGDRKVVGISQRRTRAGAWFQCVAYRSWSPDWAHLLTLGDPERREVETRLTRHAAGLAEVLVEGGGDGEAVDEVVVGLLMALGIR